MQVIMFIVVLVIIIEQKHELKERQKAMEELTMVNGCGDQFMNIPDSFLPDLEKAIDKVAFNFLFIGGQIFFSFFLFVTCMMGGKSKYPDDDDDEKKYEKLPYDE